MTGLRTTHVPKHVANLVASELEDNMTDTSIVVVDREEVTGGLNGEDVGGAPWAQPDLLKTKPDDPFPIPSVSESFQRAPELEALAEDLLTLKGHPDNQIIDDLRWEIGWGAAEGATVRFVWKQKGGTSYGAATLARCVKLGGLTKHYGRCDFAIWCAADHLAEREPTYEEMRAILFHELCHIRKVVSEDDEITYQLRPHDIEAFESEIMLFGNWRPELERAAAAFNQSGLFDGGE